MNPTKDAPGTGRLMAAVVLVAGGLAAVWGAGPARADVRAASAGVSPALVTYPRERAVTFRLRLLTESRPERFEVSAEGRSAGSGSIFGRPEALAFSGPARTTFYVVTSSLTTCSPAPLVVRQGAEPVRMAQFVELPAHSEVIVSARLGIAVAPWPGARPQAVFRIARRFLDDDGASRPTDVTPRTIYSAVPRLRLQRRGVRLTLSSTPRLGAVGPQDRTGRRFPAYPLGTSFRITGRTAPPLRSVAVRMRLQGPRGPVRTIATVRTRSDGRFVFRWRAREAGRNLLLAQYVSRRAGYASAISCPLYLRATDATAAASLKSSAKGLAF